MDRNDLSKLKEFWKMVENLHPLLIQQGAIPATASTYQMCDILTDTAKKLGYTIGLSCLIVFIDSYYAPYYQPYNGSVSAETLVTIATDMYEYGKRLHK